jgi:ATP-binding cassette subfamily B protein
VQTVIVSKTNILAGATTESLRNIELIKSLGLINQEVERLNSSTNKILELELQKVKSIRAIAFIQGTMVNMLRQGILFVLLYLIFKEYLTLGQLTTLQMYSFFIFNPLQEMGNVILSYREAEASLNNFRTLMSKAVEAIPLHPVSLESMDTIAFEHVQFAHRSAKTNAVEQISFTIKKGETIAFVGPSGSGKTTLVKLLVGLYKPSEGQITINGHNINDMDFNEQRAKIGLVSQDTQLFAGTIRENLLFVNPTCY